MITFERRHIAGDLQSAIEHITALRHDLLHLARGGAPPNIEAAPILDRIVLAKRPVPCVIGHRDGAVMRTSPLWAADWDAGWIRTANQYFRIDRILDVRTQ